MIPGIFAGGAASGGGPPPGTWTETFLTTLTTDAGGWSGGYTSRIVIPSSALTDSSAIRITLRGNSAADFTVQQAAIGLSATSGNAYDFDTTPEAVTVGASGTFVIPQGADVVIDPVTLAIPSGRAVVLAFYANSGSGRYSTPIGWTGSYYKAGNSVTDVDTTMDGSEAVVYFIRRVECLVP